MAQSDIRYLALDCETGGIPRGCSLLQLYMVVLDATFRVIEEIELDLKPNDGMYVVTAGGLNCNKIDLVRHDAEASTYKEVSQNQTIFNFLKRNKPQEGRLMPLGHGVAQDVKWVQEFLINQATWETMVSYRLRDTGSIGSALIDAGVLPEMDAGLYHLCQHYGVKNEAEHTARGDTLATVDVYRRMLIDLNSLALARGIRSPAT